MIKSKKIQKVWRIVLYEVFTDRFSSILSINDINERINHIINNFESFTAVALYKNLVFCSSLTPISEISLDYSNKFVESMESFENIFKDPKSCEIDDNLLINQEEKQILDNIIHNQMIVFNDYVERRIHCDQLSNKSEEIFNESYNSICSTFEIRKIPKHSPMYISNIDNTIHYYCTLSQALYIAVFGINPQTGRLISIDIENIKNKYPERYLCMKNFQIKYPQGTKYLILV